MLTEIDTWVLDLDNTLYPPSSGLADQLNTRIREYLRDFFDTDEAGAREFQAALIAEHGTTLRGLMTTHGVDPADYLAFEHRIDYSVLRPDPSLARAIAALPGRKFVFTNGSAYHVEQALPRLGLTGLFDGAFDILAGGLVPKPYPESYQRFVERFSVDPRRAAMFDDLARNLTVPNQLGMATIWVTEPAAGPRPGDPQYEVIGPGQLRTWDLSGFLHSLTAPAVRPSTM
jgi:putative hydrolase of the HAD superfamily